MDAQDRCRAPQPYGTNATYIYKYSRGLAGVNVPEDVLFSRLIVASVAGLALVVFCGRIAQISHAYLRQLSSLNATRRQQKFWSIETASWWADLKKYVLYAPLGKKRHNREIQLSSAVNVGTVPSRFHTSLIVLYVASQVAYCGYLNYGGNTKAALLAELRGRSGCLAVLNMVPLFFLASRNNPLIPLLQVSFDTYNLLHRWLGRIVALEGLVHTIAWAINACDEQNFSLMLRRIRDTPFFVWGMLGTCAMLFLILHSPSPVRHAFYETFLHLHQLAALLALAGVYAHLNMDCLPQLPFMKTVIAIWTLERATRLCRLLYVNLSLRNGSTKLVVQALPGEACRVTFHLPKRIHVGAGCHVYAYIPSISLWMSHPFSVAWADPGDCVTIPTVSGIVNPHNSSLRLTPSDLEKQALFEAYHLPGPCVTSTTVSLIVSARQGMTRQLYNAALGSPQRTLYTTGFIEGPYPSHPSSSFGSYGTVVMFSGGAGITHHLLHTRDLVLRAAEGRVATRQIYLIWSVRTTDHLAWVREYMDTILHLPDRREILTVKLFISKPRNRREIVSPSASVQMFPGRCRPDVVLDEVLPRRVGATLVSVCGPGAFADEVRAATRARIGQGVVVDLVEEGFTW